MLRNSRVLLTKHLKPSFLTVRLSARKGCVLSERPANSNGKADTKTHTSSRLVTVGNGAPWLP